MISSLTSMYCSFLDMEQISLDLFSRKEDKRKSGYCSKDESGKL